MPYQVPDFSIAGREPPHVGPMAHGFAAMGEAYRRIEAALQENGIAFADNTPRVTLYQAPAGEPVAAASPALDQRVAAK